jgi:uncharacterized protein YjiS (DUF1127 family)
MDRTAAFFCGGEPPRDLVNLPTGEMKRTEHDGSKSRPVPRKSGRAGLYEVPRLEELVAEPDRVRVLDAYATWALRAQAIAALNLLNAHDLRLLRRDFEAVANRELSDRPT